MRIKKESKIQGTLLRIAVRSITCHREKIRNIKEGHNSQAMQSEKEALFCTILIQVSCFYFGLH